jgi:hypothetical protein
MYRASLEERFEERRLEKLVKGLCSMELFDI